MKTTLFDRLVEISESRKKSIPHGIRATILDAFIGIFFGTAIFLTFKPDQFSSYIFPFVKIELVLAVVFLATTFYIKKFYKE